MNNLTMETAQKLINDQDSPLYVYDKAWLTKRTEQIIKATKPIGCLVRYAIKANPHPEIIKLFDEMGLHFDASSEFEVERLLKQGIDPNKISLSSQQPPKDLKSILERGVHFVATSMHQLKQATEAEWRGNIAVRINPGMGSGGNNRTTTGGVSASFGIWHEYIPEILELQSKSRWDINRLHVHIGSGADPKVWRSVIVEALNIVSVMPSVEMLDIGGGYKVSRAEGEHETDMHQIVSIFADELNKFNQKTGREISLEIEPGTWLVANCGTLLANIVDIVDTGKNGFTFLKLNTGMNDLLRPSLYGAQHPIKILNSSTKQDKYVVVGHNCESGDILTPEPGDSERIKPRVFNKASIGDIVAIGGAGAYAASMRAVGYNDFPIAKEILI